MRKTLPALLVFAATLLSCSRMHADDDPTVWSALVLATAETKPLPKEVAPFKAKLEKIFGYSNFVLIGQHKEEMDDPQEHWLVPSKMLCLQATSKRVKDGPGYMVDLKLFREKEMIVSTKVRLTKGNPLFIRGPACSRGQLVIVLMVE